MGKTCIVIFINSIKKNTIFVSFHKNENLSGKFRLLNLFCIFKYFLEIISFLPEFLVFEKVFFEFVPCSLHLVGLFGSSF